MTLSERDGGTGEVDHGGEAFVGSVVASGNSLESFEAAEEVFDRMAPTVHVEVAGDELRPIGFGRDHRHRTPLAQFGPQPTGIEGPVGQERGEIDVLNERLGTDAVVALAWSRWRAPRPSRGFRSYPWLAFPCS